MAKYIVLCKQACLYVVEADKDTLVLSSIKPKASVVSHKEAMAYMDIVNNKTGLYFETEEVL